MNDNEYIVFNAKMRRIFIEGVLCDIKGYFEQLNPDVVVTFEKTSDKEISYKLSCVAKKKFDIQRMIETKDAINNVVDYMFAGDSFSTTKISYDSIASYEIEIRSLF